MTAEIIALPTCPFRRGDPVVTADGVRMIFLGLVTPAEGEPLAKLWPTEGGGCRFVRVGLIERIRESGMTVAQTPIGRLAMRAEGNFWNAYYAPKDTMEGAFLIGSIAINAVTDNQDRKAAFMQIMIGVVSDAIKGALGLSPTWGNPEAAPEHERAGRA